MKPSVKIVLWNTLAQTKIVEELFLIDLFSLHGMKLRKIANLCNRHISYKQCGISAKPKSSCIFTKSPKLFGDWNKKRNLRTKVLASCEFENDCIFAPHCS